MTLIDIEKLEYEPFIMKDDETVDYISAEALWKAPKIDPVNHAEWTIKISDYRKSLFVEYYCSHCGKRGSIKSFKSEEWEEYFKYRYKPELTNFCPDCGCKMDLRDLYKQYKREWCETRGYSVEDMDEEVGINGECYACFDEWYKNEYRESRGV